MIDNLIKFFTFVFFLLFPVYFLPFVNSVAESDKQFILFVFSLILFGLLVVKIIRDKTFVLVRTPVDLLFFLLILTFITSSLIFAPNKIASFTSPSGTGTLIGLFLLFISLNQSSFSLYPLIISTVILSLLYLGTLFKIISAGNLLPDILQLFPFFLVTGIYILSDTYFPKSNPFKKHLSRVFKIFASILLVPTTVLSGYHFFTDQKPLLLPFSYGWVIMMETFKNFGNFLIGVGPANFSYAYTMGKPAALNLTPFWNIIAVSSSSFFLTLVTEAGILAGIFFCMIAFKVFGFFSSPIRQISNRKPSLISLIISLAFLFLLPSGIILLTLTIILLSLAAPKWNMTKKTLPANMSYIFWFVLFAILAGLFYTGKIYLANIYFRQAVKEATSGNNQPAISSLENVYKNSLLAVNTDPSNENYYGLSGNLALILAQNYSQNSQATGSAQKISSLTQQAVNDARTATQLNAYSSQNWAQLAGVYQTLSGTVIGAQQSALDAFSKQISLDPQNPIPRVGAAGILITSTLFDKLDQLDKSSQSTQLAQINQAFFLLNQAISLKPDWNNAHYNLAVLLRQTKKYPDSVAEYQRTLDLTPVDNSDYQKIKQELEQLKTLILKEATPSASSPSVQSSPAPHPSAK